jgi:membrane protease YdiL (CAAX protease family)
MKHVLLRILRFPLTRIFVAAFSVGLALVLATKWIGAVAEPPLSVGGPLDLYPLFQAVMTVLAADLAYRGYVRIVEWRPVQELSRRGAAREFGLGAILGSMLFTATIGVIAAAGSYRISGINGWAVLIPPLGMSLAAAYVEEIFTRGILFRITEEGLGTWFALVISSVLFGFAHAANPGATAISSVAIALEAGLLLGAAFMLTRRLWLAIGLHFAWNFTQGGIFGVAVSGLDRPGVLLGRLTGPTSLTGGAFGPEASVVAVVLCVVAAIATIVLAVRRGNVVPPFWTRRARVCGNAATHEEPTASPSCVPSDSAQCVQSDPSLDDGRQSGDRID